MKQIVLTAGDARSACSSDKAEQGVEWMDRVVKKFSAEKL